MKKQGTFTSEGWDFIDIWEIYEDQAYPFLRIKYSGGTGTADDPYKIAKAADITEMAEYVTDYNKYFIMKADIDMEGQIFTTAIIAADIDPCGGFDGTAFTGTFDGKGHKISNFSINGDNNNYIGLFGCIGTGGSVKNLVLENCQVSGLDYVGGLAGYNDGGNISQCCLEAAISEHPNSLNIGVSAENEYSSHFSLFFTPVAVSGFENVGGLVGYNKNAYITQCYSTVSVGGYFAVGGAAGRNEGIIRNCYSTGNINGYFDSGCVGGLAGYQYQGSIYTSYSTGKVSGYYDVGGLLGGSEGSSFVNESLWDMHTSGQTTSAGGFGKTTEQMMMRSTYQRGWNFITTWAICEGTNSPRLLWSLPVADFVCPDGVDMADYAFLAGRWMETNCAADNDCGGADLDFSGTVELKDLMTFCQAWLDN